VFAKVCPHFARSAGAMQRGRRPGASADRIPAEGASLGAGEL